MMINPAVLNIGGNRVGTDIIETQSRSEYSKCMFMGGNKIEHGNPQEGRYPSQMFVDDDTALILDKQSGSIKHDKWIGKPGGKTFGGSEMKCEKGIWYGDTGGCSKILQKIKTDTDTTEDK